MKALLIFPHQLDLDHPSLNDFDKVIIIEEFLFFKQYNFHKQKIAFHRASMKTFEHSLANKVIRYVESTSEASDIRVLISMLAEEGYTALGYINPIDNWLDTRTKKAAIEARIELIEYSSTLFINSSKDLEAYFRSDKKSFHQTTFYKKERKRLNILVDSDGKPQGDKWTFDSDNRKKYPKGKIPPSIHLPESDLNWDEAVSYTNTNFNDNPGNLAELIYPYNVAQSQQWLNHFLEQRFAEFGPFEDAIVKESSFLHHSVLTPMLNVGLLKPFEIVEKAIEFANNNKVPLQSLEGFIRQIIGWREFMRGMYTCKGAEMRTTNFWGFRRKIPQSFYNAQTGIAPIDDTIKKVLNTGYCHHIERLMVLGNFMLLCEFDPDEVYRWFMELFIDAYDWVMVPNVYSMSQFADGGLFATKPYISSSNYLRKMSNYKSGDWEEIWDGLFWRFMHKQRSFFEGNPRLGMLTRHLESMDENKLENHVNLANSYLSSLE